MDHRAIGIFDSGVGGLTVVKEVMGLLPYEKIIYFGDTARVPYGSKSKETVTKFSKQIIRFLLTKQIKAIIIACNTASSNSLAAVQQEFDIPIIGVVEPGVTMALQTTKNQKIGVIGTEATIRSNAYKALLHSVRPTLSVFSTPCPLFVPLAEEGWTENEVALLTAQSYLIPLQQKGIDTLVLGCTHYPLLIHSIQKVMGEEITLVNPASEAAKNIKALLERAQAFAGQDTHPTHEFYASDNTAKFEQIAQIILGAKMQPATKIDIEIY